jgi:heme oxygenase (biliverdin-IX-beta and delta-forming)
VNSATPSGRALEHLRARTHELHQRAEGLVDLPSLHTLARYRALLSVLLGFHRPLEQRLARLDLGAVGLGLGLGLDLDLDLDARRKAHLLEEDLRCLGVDPAQVPDCGDLPELPALPEALGCLYVLEGSTLGGQVMSRHVREVMDILPGRGGSFFASDGRDVGAMWRAFCVALEAGCPGEAQVERAGEAAVRTFGSLTQWLAASLTLRPPSP